MVQPSDWCSFNKKLLACDTFESHMTEGVMMSLNDMKVESVIVPGGCTKYIHAPEVYWKKPFKAFITEYYDDILDSGVHINSL